MGVSARQPCAERRPRALHCAPFPRAKRNRAIRSTAGALFRSDDHDAFGASQPFTRKPDIGCQRQRLSFIRRGVAPAKL
jgi:hypothetical protein